MTDHVRNMQQNLNQTKLNEDIFLNASVGIYTLSKEGLIETFNPKMVELAGANSSRDVIGLNALKLKSYRDTGLDHLFREGLRGKPFEKEVRYKSHTSNKESYRYYRGIPVFNENKTVERLLLLVEDITERKLIELQLKKALGDVKSISDFPKENPFPIMRVTATCHLTYANPCSDELLKFWGVKVGEQVPNHLQQAIRDTLDSKEKKVFDEEINAKILSFLVVPVPEKNYTNLYCRDVTEERQVERAKTEFVSLASHQLRTPLSIINWHTEMLTSASSKISDKKDLEYVGEIRQASIRMTELVNSLLNTTRLELGTFKIETKIIEVPDYIKKFKKQYRADIDSKKLDFSYEVDPEARTIKADPTVLSIILDNLISNAVKYSKENGKICINVKDSPNETFTVTITDEGYGIPADQKKDIYKKMFRADNVVSKDTTGTGLGLYMAKSLVDTLGGTIEFESELDKGTKFTLVLPDVMKDKDGSSRFT